MIDKEMIDKEKIILMSKLALYDKKYGFNDKKKDEYFKRDYVYKKNFSVRLGASIGGVIIYMFYICYKLLIQKADLFEFDIYYEIKCFLIFMIALLGVYTAIGWLIASYDYNVSQKRLRKYLKMLAQLDKSDSNDSTNNKGEDQYSHGSDIYSKEFFNYDI